MSTKKINIEDLYRDSAKRYKAEASDNEWAGISALLDIAMPIGVTAGVVAAATSSTASAVSSTGVFSSIIHGAAIFIKTNIIAISTIAVVGTTGTYIAVKQINNLTNNNVPSKIENTITPIDTSKNIVEKQEIKDTIKTEANLDKPREQKIKEEKIDTIYETIIKEINIRQKRNSLKMDTIKN